MEDNDRQRVLSEIAEPQEAYQAQIHPLYRPFVLRNPLTRSWSPIRLFLALIQPVLDLLQYHTNLTAQRDIKCKMAWIRFTISEIRHWIAIRLPLATKLSKSIDIILF